MTDLLIIGSGFGGSLLAMVARRLGYSVLLVERGTHPRFAVGESTSPLANLLLEQIARRYDLPRLLPLTNYGSWQKTYPKIGCGLKRGFSYFFHEPGQKFQDDTARKNQLLVAASPDEARADTHWLRADVDAFLMREAVALGADYWDNTQAANVELTPSGAHIHLTRNHQSVRVSARFLVDASGPRSFLARELSLPEAEFATLGPTQTLFSHFANVRRCDTLPEFCTSETPPYPIDDAALHHIFAGGWMWVLRFNNGITSAGIVLEKPLADELHLSDGAPAWARFLARFPTIAAQFAPAKPIRPFTFVPRASYRSLRASGQNWALLPSSSAFVDPCFSTGIPLTLLGIKRLGRILEGSNAETRQTQITAYGHLTLAEADHTARFIAACYDAFPQFEKFSALSQFYFAAASYSEIAHRVGASDRATRFLLQNHAPFSARLQEAAKHLRRNAAQTGGAQDTNAWSDWVSDAIAPLNIAGLCDPQKRNWYDVDLNDVVGGAEKMGLTPAQMRKIVDTAPWANGA